MGSWTPRDLTNPAYVATNLSDKDRSYALYSVNSELPGAEKRLAEQEAAWNAAQEAANNKPARGDINALKAKAADTTLPQAERDQATAQAAALQDQRDKLSEVEYQAMLKYQSTKEYVDNLQQGQSNLLAAGTVPPGVNMFAAPPGYEEKSSPAAQVQDNQNPNPTPTATGSETATSQSPTPVSAPTTAQTNANVLAALGVPPATNTTDVATTEPTTTATPQKTVPVGGGSIPYDELGNLNPGWAIDPDTTQPYYVGTERVPVETPPKVEVSQGPAYDDNGNLMPGWNVDELGTPYYVGNGFVAPATQESADQSRAEAKAKGLQAKEVTAKAQPTVQDTTLANAKGDWRVRLTLAPSATYLYKATNPGILAPLKASNGVIFPYTPQISVQYNANYDTQELIHSNYKVFQYKSSSVDNISISCDFTAQDTNEANYVLAVIHFFRSVTKMFYGQDQTPGPGVPPPLCFLHGLGSFQFDNHPLVITSFNYSLPTDVDYIRANSVATVPGENKSAYTDKTNAGSTSGDRLQGSGLNPGAAPAAPNFQASTTNQPTYVPTKMQIQISAFPIVTRNDISNRFSLRDYASGKLLRGSTEKGGGIW